MAGYIRGYTANFSFKLINFDAPRWHTMEYQNWRALDTILSYFTGFSVNRGVWENATAYIVGDRTIDDDDGSIWTALIAHTSATSGSFATDRAANPTYWETNTTLPVDRGTWVTARAYNLFDIVTTDGFAYYFCSEAHTSGVFATDLSNGKWTLIFNAGDVVAAADEVTQRIYPPSSSEPTTRPDASPSQEGDMYFNTSVNLMQVFDGSVWGDFGAAPPASTAASTSFTPASGIDATDVQAAIVEAKTDAQAYADAANVTQDAAIAATYAPKASPTFTGNPTAPTPLASDDDTSIATTAFVKSLASDDNPLVNSSASPGTSDNYARKDHVHPTDTTLAPKNAPTFTGQVVSATMRISSTFPVIDLFDSNQGANLKYARWGYESGLLRLDWVNDAYDTITGTPLTVNRNTDVFAFSQRPTFGANTPWDSGNLPAASVQALPKAHAVYTGSLQAGALNVGSVVNTTVGTYVFNFTNAMADSSYTPIISVGGNLTWANSFSRATGALTVTVVDATGTPANASFVSIVVFNDN